MWKSRTEVVNGNFENAHLEQKKYIHNTKNTYTIQKYIHTQSNTHKHLNYTHQHKKYKKAKHF